MWKDNISKVWRIKDLRNRVIFVVLMLVLFRFVAHIPIPGIDPTGLKQIFAGNQFLGLLNIFSGGTIANFSIIALGVAPYITSSIIFQLLAMVIPQLEEISKDGEMGQRKINQWTRIATVPLAFLQGYGLIGLLKQSGGSAIFASVTPERLVIMMLTMTAGTILLMWIGELISEKKIGNGISLLIFAGIISSLPKTLQNVIVSYDSSQLINIIIILVIAIVTIVGVVIITEGQRNIPVSYARRMGAGGGVSTYLPLRVNMAGVIPIIFAISIILFPTMIAQFFINAKSEWLKEAARYVITLFNNQTFYGIIYFALVLGFTFFYTAVVFKPEQVAENLQKQGGFIPGIRPGKETEKYLSYVSNRIVLFGAIFLGVIATLPLLVQSLTNISIIVGGTSLLIVVSVAIEIAKQLESQISMYEYENV